MAGACRTRLILLLAVVLAAAAPARAAADGYQVIVNPANSLVEVDRAFLRDAFLKRALTWRSGETIRPVDLSRRFPAREQFARDVLQKTLIQLKRFWNQQIFSGKGVPPPELDSEAAVIAYVLGRAGAVGYLPAGANPGGAKVVKLR